MKQVLLTILSLFFIRFSAAQPSVDFNLNNLPQSHPRVMTTIAGKEETLRLIREELWAKSLFSQIQQRTDKYVDHGPEWLSSPLAKLGCSL
jgi:hypothetical protein